MIYALQDVEFDRSAGLHSLPVRFGSYGALVIARAFHAAMIACLVLTGIASGRGLAYYLGVAFAATLIAVEHAIIRPDDLRRLNHRLFQRQHRRQRGPARLHRPRPGIGK